MRIHLQFGALIGGLLLLSFAKENNARAARTGTDTTGKGGPALRFSVPLAENTLNERFYTMPDLGLLLQLKQPAGVQLGVTKQGRSVNAWYFPGTSDKRALVIGGVHGSELSSIEVAQALVEKMMAQEERTFYSVIIIPSLFPDNAATAMREPAQTGSVLNIGRYTHDNAVDPNRQMPSPGEDLDEDIPEDHLHRTIEKENQFLLRLIREYRPDRIASVHSIRNTSYGGIYADPRTDAKGLALGYASDSSLAVDMATAVADQEGNVAGNHLGDKPTALYYKDPTPVAKGLFQKRNTNGAALKGHRGSGISMGTWGTTAIENESDPAANREAIRVITIEVPGAKRSFDYKRTPEQMFFRKQMQAFVNGIYEVFLSEKHVEG
jgi:hypothetical protein